MADFVTASELKPPSAEEKRNHEAAFRRGFTHGVATVLEAIENGVSVKVLKDWEDGPLFRWRYYADLKFSEPPHYTEN